MPSFKESHQPTREFAAPPEPDAANFELNGPTRGVLDQACSLLDGEGGSEGGKKPEIGSGKLAGTDNLLVRYARQVDIETLAVAVRTCSKMCEPAWREDL